MSSLRKDENFKKKKLKTKVSAARLKQHEKTPTLQIYENREIMEKKIVFWLFNFVSYKNLFIFNIDIVAMEQG